MRGRWLLIAVVVAGAVVAACGGGGGSDRAADNEASDDRSAEAAGEACDRPADLDLLALYATVLDPDVTARDLERVVQLADDEELDDFLSTLDNESSIFSEIYQGFTASQFPGAISFSPDPSLRLDSVHHLDKESVIIVYTVEQVVEAGTAVAQVPGRIVCDGGEWKVALADVCAILSSSARPCEPWVQEKGRDALTAALAEADIPDVVDPTVPTTAPPTTVPPPPEPTIPPGPSDGFCPYVGQPCSANVTNDPDCVCQPTGGPGFAEGGPRTLTCRGAPLFGES